MPLQSSGSISLQDMQDEFGGSHPISMSEYYRGGSHVYGNNSNVPESGLVSMGNFHGGVGVLLLSSAGTINGYGNRQEITVSSYISSGGVLIIPSDMYVWSDSTGSYGMVVDIPCTIINYGRIIGKGGNGGSWYTRGYNGGAAMRITSSGVTIQNMSGAFIAGGGGGGGGGTWDRDNNRSGGGGGAGGANGGNGAFPRSYNTNYGGTGGAINGTSTGNLSGATAGGGGGGGGGAGGGSGRQLPGTSKAGQQQLNAGGTGGGGGSVGGNHQSNGRYWSSAAGGGGGWGARGGSGGISSYGNGGAAISKTTSYTLQNSGTIYGGT